MDALSLNVQLGFVYILHSLFIILNDNTSYGVVHLKRIVC